jgi:rhodanese-related sulfurtransferase
LTLIAEHADDVAAAQRQLVRIGIERPDGSAIAKVEDLAQGELADYARVDFEALESRIAQGSEGFVVLDVRRDDERASGGVRGSQHIPMHSLLQRMAEVPQTQIWVHCASGFRASIAASLLSRAGHDVVLVDDEYLRAEVLALTSAGDSQEPVTSRRQIA